jgi:hypothetical protein
MGLTALFVV